MRASFGVTIATLGGWVVCGAAWAQVGSGAGQGVAQGSGAATPPLAAAAAPTAPAGVTPVPPSSISQVRIVRLSEIRGLAQLDRNTGHGFEPAIANMPIVQGARLQTGEGVAEIEFEDNSTLRVTPNTLIEFPQLQLRTSGAKVSAVRLQKGSVYVSLQKTPGNEFTLLAGAETLTLTPNSHVHLIAGTPSDKLAVFKGAVQAQGPAGAATVGKNATLSFDPSSQTPPTVAKNAVKDDYDAWDKDEVQYHERKVNSNSFASVPYGYGLNDLAYYGSFINMPGCGMMWQPYLVSAGWDPYQNGMWALYPGAGYSWVSPYPWGWTPYHYGSWSYCGNAGWGWQPGGNWTALNNAPGTVAAPRFGVPHAPRPPAAGSSTLVAVNMRPLAISTLSSANTFVFRKDSAGLGVPRGSFDDLRSISRGVGRLGMISSPVYAVARPGGLSTIRGGQSPASIPGASSSFGMAEAGGRSAAPSAGRAGGPSGMGSGGVSHGSAAGGSGGGHH